jgi:N6-adenosine-specific RNA methylase IME4
LVDGDNIVRAGNGVYAEALNMGLTVRVIDAGPDELIAVRRPDLTGEQAVQAALYDNRAGELSEWDVDVLGALASFSPDNLLGQLWTPDEIAAILAPTPQEPPALGQPGSWGVQYAEGAMINGMPLPMTPDAMGPVGHDPANHRPGDWPYVPPTPKVPDGVVISELPDGPEPVSTERASAFLLQYPVKLGDIWAIPSMTMPGRQHLIVCGDARNPLVYTALFPDQRPLLMHTDPPYGVNLDTTWRVDSGLNTLENAVADVIMNDDIIDWRGVYALWNANIMYIWHAGLYADETAQSLKAAEYQIRSQIIWVKSNLVISRGHYHWMHEPCWYAVREGATANWQTDRKQTTVWAIPNRTGQNQTTDPADQFKAEHISQKPVALFRLPLLNHTVPGDIVAEPFSGSGSQYVAAEQLGRIVHGCELEPRYVAATLARMTDMGLTPHKYGELAC